MGALLELKRGVPPELGKQFCPWEVELFWMTFARCAGTEGGGIVWSGGLMMPCTLNPAAVIKRSCVKLL